MKKVFTLSILLALSLFLCNCGGGSGSSNSPKGENRGEPSVVQLLPSHFVAQTNSVITLHARVLDGNGAPVINIPVSFTNLSPVGVLSALSANTNSTGIASVTIKSTTGGFSTVQVEVNKGVAQVRDRKTVYFSSQSLTLMPFMDLDVDGNDANEVYNELNDVNLFQNETDNQVNIRATVYDRFGNRAPFTNVTFGSDSSAVSFPAGNVKTTGANGEAFVRVQVEPIVSNLPDVLNITGEADNGAFNMISLFPNPVTIQTIDVTANPPTVESGATSTITALVLTNVGTPAPNGTIVQFSVDPKAYGDIERIAQTTSGVAKAKFTAAEVTTTRLADVVAKAGNTQGSFQITILPIEDTISPTVTSTTPAVGATNVAYPTTVTITFSENIDCSSVTPATITISPSVTWSLSSCSGSGVVFNGSTAANTSYTVNIGTGVKDLAGNVAVAYIFSFTTGP